MATKTVAKKAPAKKTVTKKAPAKKTTTKTVKKVTKRNINRNDVALPIAFAIILLMGVIIYFINTL